MVELTAENFEEEVLKAQQLVVVDFWGPNCAECMSLMPRIEKLAKKYEGQVKFCRLNTAAERKAAIRQKVMGIPTFLFFKHGVKSAQFCKNIEIEKLEAKIQELL